MPGLRALRVLLVEDDVDDALSARRGLSRTAGFELSHVRTAAEAMDYVGQKDVDVCLVDYRLPDVSGLQLCRQLRAKGVLVPIFVVTAFQDEDLARKAKAAGANDYLVKSVDFGDQLREELAHRLRGS